MSSEDRLKDVIANVLGVDVSEIHENSSSDTIEDWDSFAQMNLIIAIEEEFDVTIPDEEAANLTSFPLIKLVVNELEGEK